MYEELREAICLRDRGCLEQANERLIELAELHKEDALIHYHCAWSFDALGRETEAISHYVKAIESDLQGDELKGAYIGLGSTYRSVGMYDLAIQTFEKGLEVFPANPALTIFYSMALYNIGRHEKAMELLLNGIVDHTKNEEIKSFERAIRFYSTQLNTIWT
ncbi:tetratricopeptide repeat protein [Bacillus sp. 1P06AnD]|uniref:tetratricopeptide repeat protein n=1 Tax=Bacillus sp. 1P06AnD TaxID=3132208 RepID=UPI0039A068C9